jgi:hypothetical protein
MTGGVALAYHGIGQVSDGDDPQKLVVSPKHFESQVGMLLARGYRFLTAEQVIAEGSLPARAAALTFDDGFKSWLTIGLPLCEKLGVRATFYVTTGWLGDQHALVAGEAGRLLDAEDARALAAAGMELGAHSVSHLDLRTLDDIALEAELGESRSAIEEITGKPAFQLVRDNNINCTIHAGEAYGPESIAQAIHVCGAHRIGHGCRLRENGDLLHYVTDHRVPLECCPSSNVQTGAVATLESHPLKLYFDLGVRVTINTDNRLITDTSVSKELYVVHRSLDVPFSDIKAMILAGFKSSFQPFHEKQAMLRRVAAELDRYDDAGRLRPSNAPTQANEQPMWERPTGALRADAE